LSFDGASYENMSALSTGKRYKTLSDVIYPLALQVGNLTLEKMQLEMFSGLYYKNILTIVSDNRK
jgi:hypothetical protein